ncbi:putative lysine decarboxylase [Novymonas esmeraldas]|uniref:Lysine decarboxylase n=1 Tax=Novymonas esmeraldas TaxID=1808958 RepID=A0AAW0ET39_9TRYP
MAAPPPSDVASPYVQKEEDLSGKKLTPTVKSYRNMAFLSSGAGRMIRILCEFEEPQQRLQENYIRSTILFFGSARSMTQEQYNATVQGIEAKLAAATEETARQSYASELARVAKTQWMCRWVAVVEDLARRVAEFARREQDLINRSFQYIPDYFRLSPEDRTASLDDLQKRFDDLVVTTGGGPGFMEAANRGAASVPGAVTMGMGISLPFEKGLNAHVTKGLAFEFHYFFTRKFWMMYSCRAIVVAPGGFGTLDEMFELLTLKQTKKIPSLPVVLLGKEFWQSVINWQALADYGVISQAEIDGMLFTDSPDEALEYIAEFYRRLAKGQATAA